MAREPVTAAIRQLRSNGVEYSSHVYDYERFPGALGAAHAIGVDPHLTVKTIVLETEEGDGLIVLMNGDRAVSTKTLARMLGVKSVQTASQRYSRRWTGHEFGGTSPFGTRHHLPTFAQREIADMDEIYINAGSRGFVISIDPRDLIRIIEPELANIAM